MTKKERPRPAYEPPSGMDPFEVWTTHDDTGRWDCIDTGDVLPELIDAYGDMAHERPYWIWDRLAARVVWKSWEVES